MKICYDIRFLINLGSRSGIYFVLTNIFNELNTRNLDLYLYVGDKSNIRIVSSLVDNFSQDKVLYNGADFATIDVFLSPALKIPDFIDHYPCISKYTILYDCIPFQLTQYFGGIKGWFGEVVKGFNKTDYYFTISNYTKQDFLRYWPQLNEKNITTIPLSTNLKYKANLNKKMILKVMEKYNVPQNKKFIFSCSSLDPRKNLVRCIDAFIQFVEKNKIDDLVYVISGKDVMRDAEKWAINIPNYQKHVNKIIRVGYVADEDLDVFYSNAQWFVYTSQYEGFGMPPLEAMSCRCPVITSNNTSLPEVVGDAGIMIDYDSDEQHVAAYEKYYFDENYRQKMAQKGFERSKIFSWQNSVDIILNKIREVEQKKNNKPLVSVITATFNLIQQGRKDTFIQSITSVNEQTYKNIEHIVIDGASSDGTLDLLKKYQKKGWIKYYSEPDKGIYDAMNKGILKAEGKYVICLNSDDFYCDNHAIEWLVKKAEDTGADACYGDAIRVHPQTLKMISNWKGKDSIKPWKNMWPCHQTFLIRSDVMKELGLYKIKYKVSADNAFFMQLEQNNKKIVGISKDIICFRDGGFSNNNLNIATKDQIDGLFLEYGQYHGWTYFDVNNLHRSNFLSLPLSQSIALGAKLGKREWIEEYFNQLFQNYSTRSFDSNLLNDNSCEKFLLFNKISFLQLKRKGKKMKGYLLGCIPLFSVKISKNKSKIKVFGLPIFKVKFNQDRSKVKYYILGLPLLKKQSYVKKKDKSVFSKIDDKYLKQLSFFNIPIYRKVKKEIPKFLTYNMNSVNIPFILENFYGPETWGVWGKNNEYTITFFNYSHTIAHFDVKAFLHDKHPTQLVDVIVNGKKYTKWSFEKGKKMPETSVRVKSFRENTITFKVRNPVSPKSLGANKDTRQLGIGFVKIELK